MRAGDVQHGIAGWMEHLRPLAWTLVAVTAALLLSIVATHPADFWQSPMFVVALPASVAFVFLAWATRESTQSWHAEFLAWVVFAAAWGLVVAQYQLEGTFGPPRAAALALFIGAMVLRNSRFAALLGAELIAHITLAWSLRLPLNEARQEISWVIAETLVALFIWASVNAERHRSEQSQTEVVAARTEVQDLLENTQDGIVSLDNNQLIRAFNNELATLFTNMFDKAPVAGAPLAKFIPEEVNQGIQRVLREGGGAWRYTNPGRGGMIVDVTATRSTAGAGWILYVCDVSENVHLKERIVSGETRLRRDLLNMVSHEISTPLTPALLTTYAMLKKRDWSDTEQVEASLERVQRDVQRAIEAVQTLIMEAEAAGRGEASQDDFDVYGR